MPNSPTPNRTEDEKREDPALALAWGNGSSDELAAYEIICECVGLEGNGLEGFSVDGQADAALAIAHKLVAPIQARAVAAEAEIARLREDAERSFQHRNDLMDSIVNLRTGRSAAEARASTAEAEVARLKEAIRAYLDGNYDHPRAHRPGKCRHGVWFYEDCCSCVDAHFAAALTEGGSNAV